MSIALVPIKRLSTGKSRLATHLSREQLEQLSIAMLEDVVEALRGAEPVRRVVVVTPDEEVAARAEAAGAEGLLLVDPGLNPSLEAAAQRLHAGGSGASLIVLGDVAGVTSADIETLHAALAAQGGGVALAASNDGGTSALLRDPCDAIPCRFGPDSAKAHREAAERCGVAFTELSLPSLAIDLDQPADIERFLKSEAGGRRTRALLRAWNGEAAP